MKLNACSVVCTQFIGVINTLAFVCAYIRFLPFHSQWWGFSVKHLFENATPISFEDTHRMQISRHIKKMGNVAKTQSKRQTHWEIYLWLMRIHSWPAQVNVCHGINKMEFPKYEPHSQCEPKEETD